MSIPKNAGQPFTAKDDQSIVAMHSAGCTPEKIAADLLRTVAGIRARLERLGLCAGTMAKKQASFLSA